MHRRKPAHFVAGIFAGTALAACALLSARPAVAQQPTPIAAAPPPPLADDSNDPYEATNRAIFGFNQNVDRAVLVPVANAYRAVIPSTFRDMIHDFLQNLNSPIIFANDVLQGQPGLASQTFGRALLNTTIGFGGFIDVASKWGVPYHTNDLGITLATWGVEPGPYLMLPILGPSNPRDTFGDIADSFGDPGNIVASEHHRLWASFLRSAVSGIDERSRNIESLAEIERTSLDFYATVRSLARQRRAAQIRHQKEDVPNAAPLQGANALPTVQPRESVAALPAPATAAMSYQMMSSQSGTYRPVPVQAPSTPSSLAGLQKSSMAPSAASGR
ncbi:MAG TPA: VacJ family lipoprotein [Stellaceae bacterium]|nr:VacJ family lipoprotein [Stellaceae bacterium]